MPNPLSPNDAPLSPERWDRVLTLFHDALAHAPEERDAFLRAACGADGALYRQVNLLLAADATDDTLLQTGGVLQAGLMAEQGSMQGEQIGPYRIEDEIGRGGMGVVYRAHRDDVGTTVAIKFLRERFPSADRLARFLAEQRTLGRMAHPGIARLLDAGTTEDGTPFFVMEHVEGVPITDYCSAHALDLANRLQLFQQVCDAVRYAHANAVVHRDLKPSNVFITEVDGQPRVKLLDFGIAKLLADEAEAGLTRTDEQLLTPAYAAPEQVGSGAVSTAADVYALGALLYELLTGRHPLDIAGASLSEAIERIEHETPDPPSETAAAADAPPVLPSTLRGDLDVICQVALRKKPERRYASAEALGSDIARFLERRPITARPDTLTYRTRMFVRRHRAGVAVAAAAVVLIAAVVTLYTVRLAAERDRAEAQAATAESVVEFLVETLDEGNPNAAPGDTLTVYDIVDRAEARAGAFQERPLVHASVLDAVGRVRMMHGDLDRADSLHRAGLGNRQATLGPGHPDVATSLTRLGDVRVQQGRYAEADSLLRSALSLIPSGPLQRHDLRRATTLRLLARSQMLQSQLATADSLFKASLDLQQRYRAPTHREVVNTYTDLGRTQLMNGDYDAAETNFRHALDGFREEHPEGHTVMSALLTNLATIHRARGRYDQADSLYTRALKMMTRVVGPTHPNTASILNNLGANAYHQGDFDAAARHFREALSVRTALLGDMHPDVAAAHNNLAAVLMRSQRFAEAEPHQRRAYEILETTLGPNHANTITALDNVAGLHEEQGDLAIAESIRRDVLARYRQTLGPEHPRIGMALTNLGALLEKRGAYGEAEKHLQEALTLRRTILEDGHADIASTLAALGRVHASQARWAEAEEAYREALATREAQTPEHEATASARLHLGDALRAQGRFEEAESHIVDGFAMAQSASPDVRAEGRAIFQRFYEAWGRPGRAVAVRDSLALDDDGALAAGAAPGAES